MNLAKSFISSIILITFVMFFTFIFFIDAYAGGHFTTQSSSKNKDWGFDFVETFDNLQTWKGNSSSKGFTFSNLPKNSDGSPSNWDFYFDSYLEGAPNEYSIDSYGHEFVIGGSGKSARIDIKEACQDLPNYYSYGSNRLGINWADENDPKPEETGYSEFYLFYMVKIPRNEFPTGYYDDPKITCDDSKKNKSGSYNDSKDYVEFSSWKFGNFNMGTTKPLTSFGKVDSYSPYHVIPHLKTSTGDHTQVYLRLEPNDESGSRCLDREKATSRSGFWGTSKSINSWIREDKWFGVEFHFKNAVESGKSYTYFNVWLYDEDGKSWKIIDNEKKLYYCQPSSHKWNEFFFGGNNSGQYVWGEGMNAPYYVDDFIIDDERIGPKYFSLT